MHNPNKILHRVVTFLDRSELDFLDSISKDILFSTGNKIPRSTILKELIDIFLPTEPKTRTKKGYENLVSTLTNMIEQDKKEEKC